jgi:hypothetical protein
MRLVQRPVLGALLPSDGPVVEKNAERRGSQLRFDSFAHGEAQMKADRDAPLVDLPTWRKIDVHDVL